MLRRTGITAEEALGLAGLAPLTPLQIYNRKIKSRWPLVPLPDPELRATYHRDTGRRLLQRPMFRNPVQRFAITEKLLEEQHQGAYRLVQLASLRSFSLGGGPPSDLVAAMHWNLGATGRERGLLAICAGRSRSWSYFHIEFDQNTFSNLYGFAEHFMAEHVLQKEPPK